MQLSLMDEVDMKTVRKIVIKELKDYFKSSDRK